MYQIKEMSKPKEKCDIESLIKMSETEYLKKKISDLTKANSEMQRINMQLEKKMERLQLAKLKLEEENKQLQEDQISYKMVKVEREIYNDMYEYTYAKICSYTPKP